MNSQNLTHGYYQHDNLEYFNYYNTTSSTPLPNYAYSNYYLFNNNYQPVSYYESTQHNTSSHYSATSDNSYEISNLNQSAASSSYSPQNYYYYNPENYSMINPVYNTTSPNSYDSSTNSTKNIKSPESISSKSTSTSSSPKQQKQRSRIIINHQPLPESAIDILNDWFETHINHPYPTTDEKYRLAEQTGITVKQVNSWFCNRRNRSQNTKPKRIKRQLEQEITNAINELAALNPNQTHVIEKVFSTLLK